jgi:hypothetical protein
LSIVTGTKCLRYRRFGAAELFHGLHRARNAGQRRRREAFLNFVLDMMPVLPFDLPEARVSQIFGRNCCARELKLPSAIL